MFIVLNKSETLEAQLNFPEHVIKVTKLLQ